MSMHLCGPYLTTTNSRKRKAKKKTAKLIKAEAEHEAYLKKLGVGKTKLPTDARGNRTGIHEIPNYKTSTPDVGLSNSVAANGILKETQKYTGDEIAGIVTTHKSNLMPVRRDNKQAAKDAANMRR